MRAYKTVKSPGLMHLNQFPLKLGHSQNPKSNLTKNTNPNAFVV